ncbi:MAG: histidine triad nucleotide-binding protein [Candidatus Manganitrophaceae bacterium]|nr:MAG: histidine triad nucleotide-binding protein [Candidatus Manganitrophaceae bacterium]
MAEQPTGGGGDCLFCKIIEKKIPSKIVYEDEKMVAFEDIQPQAPVHLLLIPRKHISGLLDLQPEEREEISHLFLTLPRLAREKGIAERGFRTVVNSGKDAGQSVFHLHVHLLGGRSLRWPPG